MTNKDAIEAAAKAVYELTFEPGTWELEADEYKDDLRDSVRIALEAAAPHMLANEREQYRLAHLDAIVNRDTADRLEQELETAKADAWDEGWDAYQKYDNYIEWGGDEVSAYNPYETEEENTNGQ